MDAEVTIWTSKKSTHQLNSEKNDLSLSLNWWYRSYGQIPTLLSLATASEMDVLKSSGLFWARVVIRLVAAVTTPWKQINTLIPACRFSCMQSQFKVCKPACSYPQSTSKAKTHENLLTKDRSQDEKQCSTPNLHQMHLHTGRAETECRRILCKCFFSYMFLVIRLLYKHYTGFKWSMITSISMFNYNIN